MSDRLLLEDGSGYLILEDDSGMLALRHTYAQEVVEDVPNAYWRLGEPSGNFVDTMVGNDATVGGGTPTRSVANTALTTDDGGVGFGVAAAEWLTVADSADLKNADAAFTWEFWYRRDTDTGTQVTAFQKGSTSYSIGVTNGDKLFIGKVGTAVMVTESGTTPADGAWHHWVFTRTGSGAGNTLIYKDGVEGHTDVAPVNTLVDTANALEIGRESTTGPGGILDELALYKAILSSGRINEHWIARTVAAAAVGGDFYPIMGGGYYP